MTDHLPAATAGRALDMAGIGRGFDDAVSGSQCAFRALMAAIAEPGRPVSLATPIEAPAGLARAAAVVLLTMADHETPIWLAPALGVAVENYIRFHCASPLVAHPREARFAVLDGSEAGPALAAFDPGEDRYPDRSATVIVQCTAWNGGAPASLSGPGIRGARVIAPSGLRPGFWREVGASGARYPLGIDLLLVVGGEVLGLPRSVQVTRIGGEG